MKTQLAPMPQYGKGKEGISIITACRNRSENLKASLESWLQCEDVAEIIIVDWASTEPVSSWLFECVDDRVKLISVTNIHRWTLTHAFNLAACFADYKQLCKMDADYEIESDFFKHHQLKPGLFYSGAGVKTSDENEKHLNGLVFLEHEKFFSLNGFNERIITYGWDDSDLNERLKESGLRKKVIDKKYVQHLRHSDYQRGRYKRKFPNLKRFIQGNRKHARKKPWGEGDRVIKYACSKIDTQHYSSTPIVVNQNDSRPKLFIHVEHGLGSRLAAIASGMALAIQLKREFHLVWEQSTHCECDFVDLFDSQWPISECWNAEALDPNAEIYDLLSFDDQLRNHDIKGSQDNDIYIHARTRVRDTRIRNYKEEIVLQQLMPKQEIRQQIARHDVSNMIGLHVRTEGGNVNTDNPWDAAEHFSEREFEHIDKWRKYSQLDTFFDELDRIILEEPDVRFFLCTDRPEHYKSFLNRYGRERIYHIPRKHFDRSQKQIETALIDLYLLSQTRYILGSSYSSFSDVAAILGTSRILRAGEDF
jgi:glycosyltransferase involved in cell wall biosynthesis